MDPNATLKEMLDLAQHWKARSHSLRVAELLQSLDHWLSSGGFLPDQWNTVCRHAKQCTCNKLSRLAN